MSRDAFPSSISDYCCVDIVTALAIANYFSPSSYLNTEEDDKTTTKKNNNTDVDIIESVK